MSNSDIPNWDKLAYFILSKTQGNLSVEILARELYSAFTHGCTYTNSRIKDREWKQLSSDLKGVNDVNSSFWENIK